MMEMLVLAIWLALVLCAGIVAERKHRSVAGWVILTMVFTPRQRTR